MTPARKKSLLLYWSSETIRPGFGTWAPSRPTSRLHELLQLAVLGGGELELVEAQLREGSPAAGQTAGSLQLPDGCSIFAVIREERALSVRPDTEQREGDKVIGIGRTECEGECCTGSSWETPIPAD